MHAKIKPPLLIGKVQGSRAEGGWGEGYPTQRGRHAGPVQGGRYRTTEGRPGKAAHTHVWHPQQGRQTQGERNTRTIQLYNIIYNTHV